MAASTPDLAKSEPVLPPPDSDKVAVENQVDYRLDPSTLWIPLIEALLGAIIPLSIATLFIGLSGGLLLLAVALLLVPTLAFHFLNYRTLTYRTSGTELIIKSGWMFRRERRIPFDRVQEVEIHQSGIQRVCDKARLVIKTAGSHAQEASLSILARPAADALKAAVVAGQPSTTQPATDEVSASHDFERTVTLRELILAGLTSRLAAALGAVVAAIVYFQLFLRFGSSWMGELDEAANKHGRLPADRFANWLQDLETRFIPDLGPLNFLVRLVIDETLPKSILLAFLGLLASLVAFVVRYHGFQLTRRDELLGTSYGLWSVHRGTLSRGRIQALKLEESLLRRWLGLASVRVDSAGDRNEVEDSKKRDLLFPATAKENAHEIARQAMPELDDLEPSWQKVSRKAVMRGSKKGWLLMLLAMAQTYQFFDGYCLIWIPAFPLIYGLNYQWYRNTGYHLAPHHFLSRQGWLNRATISLPIKNIQNVSVRQSFFDRRLNLATISIDTAGQSNTGGGPVLRHVPLSEARRLQTELTQRAAASEFCW